MVLRKKPQLKVSVSCDYTHIKYMHMTDVEEDTYRKRIIVIKMVGL